MEVTYELNQKEFYDAFISHRNRSAFSKWFFRILVSMVFLFLGVGLVMLVVHPDASTLSSLVPIIGVAAFWAAILWAAPWWGARLQFNKQPAAQGPRTMFLDSGGVHWRWNGGSTDIEWKNFIRFLEAKNHFLLYSSPVSFNIVPKRALTADQVRELRTLLSESLVRDAASSARKGKISPQTWVFLVVVGVAFVLLVMVIRNIR